MQRNGEKQAVPLEGPQNITAEGSESTTVPKPLARDGKLECPVCNALFSLKKAYDQHEHDMYKAGTSTSSAIY